MLIKLFWIKLTFTCVAIQGLDVDSMSSCANTCDCTHSTFDSENEVLPYRPVVFFHGLFGGGGDFNKMSNRIQEKHPGTLVFLMKCYSGWSSLLPLRRQVNKIGEQIIEIGAQFPNGINLVCHSQGGLICRAILQIYPNHNVRNFISLSAPQAGLCGSYGMLPCNMISRVLLTWVGQLLSYGNMWNDPDRQVKFKKTNKFLATFNNVEQLNTTDLKAGLIKLQSLVLIGGPDDGTIKPWQSSQFGFYQDNSRSTIEELHTRAIYKTDAIGLKTLDDAKKLTIYTIPEIEHVVFLTDNTVIDKYILPHLD